MSTDDVGDDYRPGEQLGALRRDYEPHRGALLRMAEALGVPVERFAEGVDDPAGDEAELGQGKPRRTPRGRRGR